MEIEFGINKINRLLPKVSDFPRDFPGKSTVYHGQPEEQSVPVFIPSRQMEMFSLKYLKYQTSQW